MAATAVEKEVHYMYKVDPETGDLIRSHKLVVGGIKVSEEDGSRSLAFVSEAEAEYFQSYVNRSKKNDKTIPGLLEAYDNLKAGRRASGKPRFWQQNGGAAGKPKSSNGKNEFLTYLKNLLEEKDEEGNPYHPELTITEAPGGLDITHEGVTRLIKVK